MALKEKIQELDETIEQTSRQERREKQRNFQVVRRKRTRVRLIPIWLRVVIVTVLAAFCFLFGAMFGYSGIGDGKATDVFKASTWTHIRDLVEKEK